MPAKILGTPSAEASVFVGIADAMARAIIIITSELRAWAFQSREYRDT